MNLKIDLYNIPVDSVEEYNYIVRRGFHPLIDSRFNIRIKTRVEIQKKRFKTDVAFYRYCWELREENFCEECGKPLREYSAVFVSHILTRGAHPDKRHDPRNHNILCFEHHRLWENGTKEQRSKMRIYPRNELTREILIREYNELRQINKL